MKKAPWLFVEKDPEGRRVGLREDRWKQHILLRHPALANHLHKVREAITTPQYIYLGNRPFSLVYIGQPFPAGTFFQGEAVYVVAYFDQTFKQGTVATAYITPQPYQGKLVWKP